MQYVSSASDRYAGAALCFAALTCFARYLKYERWKDSRLHRLACFAILTKGAALLLAAVRLYRSSCCGASTCCAAFVLGSRRIVAIVMSAAYTLLPNTGFANLREAQGIRFDTRAIGTLPGEIERDAVRHHRFDRIGMPYWLWIYFAQAGGDLTVAAAAGDRFSDSAALGRRRERSPHFVLIEGPLMLYFAAGAGAIARRLRWPRQAPRG